MGLYHRQSAVRFYFHLEGAHMIQEGGKHIRKNIKLCAKHFVNTISFIYLV